jgi:hypothetical protein
MRPEKTTDSLVKKWASVLDDESFGKLTNYNKRRTVATVLENQQEEFERTKQILSESAPTLSTGAGIANFDPILISLVRRAMPNLIAYDVCGVQPMVGPTGLIFAMKSRYTSKTGTEALFNEANTAFTGQDPNGPYGQTWGAPNTTGATQTFSAATASAGTDPVATGFPPTASGYTTGRPMLTAQAEALGDGVGADFNQMAFSIDKISVEAKTRALKAEYSVEVAQDLKAIHGLDAETELANILSAEILTEINREVIRTIYYIAVPGAAQATTPGIFDLDVDANGRWSVEKFKGLMFQVEREANAIAKATRRGRGNVIICSSDVASALVMAGKLDYTPAIQSDLTVDDTGNTFTGVLNGRFRVYIDPYFGNSGANEEFLLVGYKGSNSYDCGLFYAPYVPLQLFRAQDPHSFQPKIAFKTRYGLVPNPFWSDANANLQPNSSAYYRMIKIVNLL